mmetsp:Transcript_97738/g.218738  ORF Transcript_97738/g.218738 Transcript_97738/m.218738 type:complete len:233 (+) Transcript_97738:234-932(+)
MSLDPRRGDLWDPRKKLALCAPEGGHEARLKGTQDSRPLQARWSRRRSQCGTCGRRPSNTCLAAQGRTLAFSQGPGCEGSSSSSNRHRTPHVAPSAALFPSTGGPPPSASTHFASARPCTRHGDCHSHPRRNKRSRPMAGRSRNTGRPPPHPIPQMQRRPPLWSCQPRPLHRTAHPEPLPAMAPLVEHMEAAAGRLLPRYCFANSASPSRGPSCRPPECSLQPACSKQRLLL